MLDKLLYADDLAENAKSEGNMQVAVDRMSQACHNFDLKISTKNEIVQQLAPGKPFSEPIITMNGHKLQNPCQINKCFSKSAFTFNAHINQLLVHLYNVIY